MSAASKRRAHDIKRVLVMEDQKLEGIVSLGDLTAQGVGSDMQSDISRSEPNN